MEEKCIDCLEIDKLFNEANVSNNKHDYVNKAYEALKELRDLGKITVYMADYNFDSFNSELERESQFTYMAYLQCKACGRVYLLGVCIRGVPMFKVLDAAPNIEEFKAITKKSKKIYYSDNF